MIAIAGLLTALAGPVSADQYTDQISADQHQQQRIDQTIASLKAQIAAAQTQEATLRSLISGLNSRIATTQGQIASAQSQLRQIESDLRAAQQQLAEAEQQLADEKHRLASALVVVYEMQQESTPLNNLFTSGNFNSFFTTVIDDTRITAAEKQLIGQIEQQQALIEQDINAIALKREHQRVVLQELNDAEVNLESERVAQQSALWYLQQLQARDQRLAAQWAAAYNTLNSQIAYLQKEEAAALAAGGGHGLFVWPLNGVITQGFGCTPFTFEAYDPNCPSLHFHNGIDIATSCGADVVAADAGIAYTEPYEAWGFGNYIIIVHGNGWETLYGHLEGFAISSGQTVHRGQLIGWEGSTGNSTGCHLHFGVNHNGVWVNPLNYLS